MRRAPATTLVADEASAGHRTSPDAGIRFDSPAPDPGAQLARLLRSAALRPLALGRLDARDPVAAPLSRRPMASVVEYGGRLRLPAGPIPETSRLVLRGRRVVAR